MIIIIHGNNIEASRAELMRLKHQSVGYEIRELDGKSLDTNSLIQALGSNSMFGNDRMVCIENLFGRLGRKTKQIESYVKILKDMGNSCTIVLWEEKEINKTVLSALGTNVQIKLFKIPVLIFQFLDSIKSQSAPFLFPLYKKLLVSEAPELIFIMTIRRMRKLIMVKDGVTPTGLQSWQTSRLTSQAKFFTMEKLIHMYKRLGDIEYSIKSGSSPFDMRQHLELFIADL